MPSPAEIAASLSPVQRHRLLVLIAWADKNRSGAVHLLHGSNASGTERVFVRENLARRRPHNEDIYQELEPTDLGRAVAAELEKQQAQ